MRLIFEDHKYDIEKIDNVLSFLLSDKDRKKGTYTPKCVGYFYNPNINNGEGKPKGDIVFVLPKVLLSPATDGSGKKETLFGVEPEKLISLDWETWKDCDIKEGNLTKKEIFDFVYGFSIWIYRAIEVYRKNLVSRSKSLVDDEEDEDADIETNKSIRVGKSGKKIDNTFMDILLSLVDFHKQHHDYIMYVMKMAHSGFNKINWTRTVTRSAAIIQDDVPVYLNPINKRKEMNFDEELLIIFYSILNYIHEKYGFQISNNPGYTLIKGKMFESYMDKQGKHRLLKIKYKYFSDTALKLWNLCYAFFDKTSTIHAQSNTTDYLLVNSFHTVFEAMIDELIGDKNLPKDLKYQEGGSRRVDSLYTYKYLMENLEEKEVDMTQKIYHIGDAKYHKRTSVLKDADIPKQFDYATNVVKWHMDLLRNLLKVDKDAEEYKKIQLYDDITKGFNIIPNFFVSAKVEDLKKDYDNDEIKQTTITDKATHEQTMFGDQLFDRNTLFALHYDVRFLYVLKQYAMNRSSNKAIWKETVRDKFRKGILEFLNQEFEFYQVHLPTKKVKKFIRKHFYELEGKVFSFSTQNDMKVLIYAQKRDNNDDAHKWFTRDDDETNIIDGHLLDVPYGNEHCLYKVEDIVLGETQYKDIDKLYTEFALVGYYKNQEHLDWILDNGIYNIPTEQRGKKANLNNKLTATYLILHNETLGNYLLKIVNDTISYIKREHLPEGEYKPGHKDYYIYHVSEDRTENKLLKTLIDSEIFQSRLEEKIPTTINLKRLYSLAEEVPQERLRYTLNDESIFSLMVAEDGTEYNRAH